MGVYLDIAKRVEAGLPRGPQAESTVGTQVQPGAKDLKAPVVGWHCPCCKGTRRWRSIYGAVVCARCHPPADAALVAGWEGEA
jgi:hypothetical protein